MNIKKIIKEEIDNFDWVGEGQTPLSWLIDNFGDLTPVVDGNKTFYVDGNNKILFFYYQGGEDGVCYVNNDEIWFVLRSRFGINYGEITEVLTTWLDKVYGITGLKPSNGRQYKQTKIG